MAASRRPPQKPPRVRRDGAVVRTAILDAAERRLIAAGPSSLRLQDVATDAGISHPNVLHHFGSRDGLIQAVIGRALDAMNGQLVEAISHTTGETDHLQQILDGLFDVLARGGHGRLIVWLSLAGVDISTGGVSLPQVVDAAHALRKLRVGASRRIAKADTTNVIILAAIVLTGATVLLPSLLRQLGLPADDTSSKKFRDWFSQLLIRHLDLE